MIDTDFIEGACAQLDNYMRVFEATDIEHMPEAFTQSFAKAQATWGIAIYALLTVLDKAPAIYMERVHRLVMRYQTIFDRFESRYATKH